MALFAGSAAYDVQQSIFRRLSSDPTVSVLVSGRVLDAVPDNTPFPYITIGDLTETDAPNTQLTAGRELKMNIHGWSRAKGMAELQIIMDAVVSALEDVPLDGMAHWNWTLTSYEMLHTMRELDGITRHGALRMRVRVSRNA
jgi:hypothetical protein